jgi:hypothetical protein
MANFKWVEHSLRKTLDNNTRFEYDKRNWVDDKRRGMADEQKDK